MRRRVCHYLVQGWRSFWIQVGPQFMAVDASHALNQNDMPRGNAANFPVRNGHRRHTCQFRKRNG